MHKVENSSNIHAIDWKDGTLTVHFKGGGNYTYEKVPADLHKQFVEAESPGKFFGEHIRGKFDHKKGENWS